MAEMNLIDSSSGGTSASHANSAARGRAHEKYVPDYVFVFPFSEVKEESEQPPPSGCCPQLRAGRNEKKEKKNRVARAKIRAKLLKVGFEIHQFKSRDGDEVMMGIWATEDQVMKHAGVMAVRHQLKEEFGGGFVPFSYERRQMFDPDRRDKTKPAEPGMPMFRSGIRSNIVLNLIELPTKRGGAGISVGKALDKGKVIAAFAMHDNVARKFMLNTWVRQFYKPQPLEEIRDYFGEKIALYFAWLGFYTRWLVYACCIGLIPFFIGPGSNGNPSSFDNVGTPLYCFFLAIWSTLFLEFWKRENATLAFQWGVKGIEEAEVARPAFRGDIKPGVYVEGVWIDLQKDYTDAATPEEKAKVPQNIYYPGARRIFKLSIGAPMIFTAIGCVIAATVGLLILRMVLENTDVGFFWGGTLGGVLNGLAIAILNEVYSNLAQVLNDWENHRTETDYEDNLIAKTFLFQFVNSYISLFYIAFFKNNYGITVGKHDSDNPLSDRCEPSIGCMGELSAQLLSILVTRTVVGQLGEVLAPVIMARSKVYFENRAMMKEALANNTTEAAMKVMIKPMTKIEKQSKMVQYPSTFADYNEMIIQYGYVTLFAAAMPLASLIALVNNIIEIRTDALKLLLETQRPNYWRSEDIGTWYAILEIMSTMSVITNILVLIVTSDEMVKWYGSPDDFHARNKALWAAIFCEHAILILKYIVAALVPDVPASITKAIATQEYRQTVNLGDDDAAATFQVGDAEDDLFDKKEEQFELPTDLDDFDTDNPDEEISLENS